MSSKVLTIYRIGREEAKLTQIEAAEKLEISTRQLSRFENLETIPDSHIVSRMVKVYDAEWLGYKHLKEFDDVGRMILPNVKFENVGLGTLQFFKEHSDIEDIKTNIIEIVCDGVIDDDEKEEWSEYEKAIEELAGASLALRYAKRKSPSELELQKARD